MKKGFNCRKKLIFVAIIFGLLTYVNTPVYGQLTLTLKEAIDSVLSRNLQIKQAVFSMQVSNLNLKQSKYNRLPNLTSSPQASLNWGRTLDVSTYNYIGQRVLLANGSLNSQFPIFLGGLLKNQILQNKLLLDADKTTIAKIKNDLTLQVATVFFQILAGQDLQKATENQLKVAKMSIEKVQKGLNAGSKSAADLALAQAQIASTELDLTNIGNQLSSSMLTLGQLMEMPKQKLILTRPEIKFFLESTLEIDTSQLINEALMVNPETKIADLQKQVAYQDVKLARAALLPSLSLFGAIGSNFSDARSLLSGSTFAGYETIGFVKSTNQSVLAPVYNSVTKKYKLLNQLSDNFYQAGGVSIVLPIFNRFNGNTNLKKAKLAYEIADVSSQLAKNNLIKILNQALNDLGSAIKTLAAAKSSFQSYKQVLYVSEKRYTVGLLNDVDYNIAVNSYNKSELYLIQAEYDIILKRKIIDYYIGKDLEF